MCATLYHKLDEAIKYDYWGIPYPSFELTNNNAEIKAAKDRLERLTKVRRGTLSKPKKKIIKLSRIPKNATANFL